MVRIKVAFSISILAQYISATQGFLNENCFEGKEQMCRYYKGKVWDVPLTVSNGILNH